MAIDTDVGRIERVIVGLMGIEASRLPLGSSANQPVAIAAMTFCPAPHPMRPRRSGVSLYTSLQNFEKGILGHPAFLTQALSGRKETQLDRIVRSNWVG